MVSPATIQRSPTTTTSSSPLHRLSTFKNPPASTHAPPPPPSSILDSFAKDPILSPFLSPSFSSTSFSSAALSSGSPASTAEHLLQAIRQLDSQIRSHVLSNHPLLLTQLSSLNNAEVSLSTLRSSISSLQSSVRRVRSELSEPHNSILSKTVQLSNLHRTSELLSHSIRAIRLSKKLRDLMASAEAEPDKLDLAKAAQLHNDILTLCEEYDLGGIDMVDEEINAVKEIGSKLRSEAMKVLEKGMEGLNQAEGMGVKSVSVALDMKAISAGGGSGFGPGGIRGSGTPQIGGSGRAREALWQRMGSCMDQLHSIMVAIWHLQRVLSKKRDPFSHVLLLDEVIKEDDPKLTDRVWEALVKAFATQMKSAFTASSFVKEIFTNGYPKLFSMMENLLEGISRDTDVKGVLPAIPSEGKAQMVAAIETFQMAFLAGCLSRLSDIVNSVFPVSSRGSVPSKEQVSRILSRIQEEIEAVQLDARLTLLVLREISKILLLIAERAEYLISTGPEARQVSGPATAAQLKNFALCQHLQEIHTRVTSMIIGLPTIAADVLSPSLGAIYGVACDSITSLFQAMIDRLESCILQIHDQNFSALGMDAAMDNNASPYMEELQKCILRIRSEFLSRLLPSSANAITAGTETICTRLVRSMASRVLILFIRHASLVRPLSESGKLRMARDMAELELAVGQNLFPVEQLGVPYRALRAFRPLIFLETSQLGASPLQDLPPSVILHHLYSRGPEDLQSPLQRNKLTHLQYSLWLDSQGEDQIWKGIKVTLDDYAQRLSPVASQRDIGEDRPKDCSALE
ncbi:GDSL esterase/lipase [Hibiscus syriacus]|uniref:Conserved oligomeric Golgi complex subunit 5 n=1 Tax=Hibiscus syriacus TaxID=106335 RepID=A0A6A2ZSH3_HIBSY|nr:GDSL esterase/lipase [Hibiscus syriacus]